MIKYNDQGDIILEIDEDGYEISWTWEYHEHGKTGTKNDEYGDHWVYSYNKEGTLVGETDPSGGHTSYTTCADGSTLIIMPDGRRIPAKSDIEPNRYRSFVGWVVFFAIIPFGIVAIELLSILSTPIITLSEFLYSCLLYITSIITITSMIWFYPLWAKQELLEEIKIDKHIQNWGGFWDKLQRIKEKQQEVIFFASIAIVLPIIAIYLEKFIF